MSLHTTKDGRQYSNSRWTPKVIDNDGCALDECLKGRIFGRLTATGRTTNEPKIRCSMEAVCSCGRTVWRNYKAVTGGSTSSCGCLLKEYVTEGQCTHGESRTRLHTIWKQMRSRCRLETSPHYRLWGGRGIRVCSEWDNSYTSFRDWAEANGYADDLTIDRKDNNLGYSPANCRWVTRHTQSRNTRRNVNLTVFGETKCINDWINDPRCVVNRHVLGYRIRRGIDAELAMTTPTKLGNRLIGRGSNL